MLERSNSAKFTTGADPGSTVPIFWGVVLRGSDEQHRQAVLEDLKAAERLLARYFGPTTTLRLELARMIANYEPKGSSENAG